MVFAFLWNAFAPPSAAGKLAEGCVVLLASEVMVWKAQWGGGRFQGSFATGGNCFRLWTCVQGN